MRASFLLLLVVVAMATRPLPAFSAVDFDLAGTQRFGAAQRDFFDSILKAKSPLAGDLVKSLVVSHETASAAADRPPIDIGALSRDVALGSEAWALYAEELYADGQYEAASQALKQVAEEYRQGDGGFVSALQMKLALRGFGTPPTSLPAGGKSPLFELNLALADIKAKNNKAAFAKLRAIADGPVGEQRDRALILGALLTAELGSPQEARLILSRIDGSSVLAADAMLAWLRVAAAPSPTQVLAIERQIASAGKASPVVWEVRDRLLSILREQGATADAVAQAVDAVSATESFLTELNREKLRIEAATLADLGGAASTLPDERRRRVEGLFRQKDALTKLSSQLGSWRPYMTAYKDRLSRDRIKFSEDVGAEMLSSRKIKSKDVSGLNALFHLDLVKLLGKPADPDAVYRMFFGLALWEMSYEYPDDWRPSAAQLTLSGSERRRQRDEIKKRERDDKMFLPVAIDHLKALSEKIDNRLKKIPKFVYSGLADEGGVLLDRGERMRRDIAVMLPTIDSAVRQEFVDAIRDRKRLAQRWMMRFAAQAMSDSTRLVVGAEQPRHVSDRPLSLKRGEPLVSSIENLTPAVQRSAVGELPLGGVRDALKSLIQEGGTREIRADALRLRAQMTIALYEAQAIPSAKEAVDHYSTLLRDYSDLVDQSDMIYQLARAQDLSLLADQSLATLEDFTRKYPKDPRAREAAFRIAEAQFALSEYLKAKAGYEAVIRQGDKRYLDQAEYKLAWTLFKQGDFRSALPKFVSVIDRGYGADVGSDLSRRNRMQDALRAAALTFSNLEGPAEVEKYFAGKARRPYVPEIYQTLARYYLEHRRVNDASVVYSMLNKYYPEHSQAPMLLADLVLGARAESLAKVSFELQETFVNRYSITSPYWEKASPEVRAQILKDMKPFLGQLGQMYHADAQEQHKSESFAKATKYYRQYVDSFPNEKETPEMHFLLAEARMESGELANAIADYEKLAYGYGPHAKAAESGYALLVALQKLVEQDTDPIVRKNRLATLAAQSARFSEAFPGDLRAEPVLVKASEDILAVGDAREAVRLSANLLARKPPETVRRRASQVLAHGYFESNDFAKAEAAYVDALQFKGIPAKELNEMTERLSLSIYRQAEELMAAENTDRAIDTFLRVGKVAPGTEAVPNSIVEATVLLAKVKRWPEVINLLESFSERFPGHKLNQTVPLRLAVAYENDGRFLKASDALEQLSLNESNDQLAREMLERAAELRGKGGRTDLSVATYERYLKLYPQPIEKATEVRQLLADVANKAGDLSTRDRWLTELVAVAKTIPNLESVRVRFLAAKAAMVFGNDNAQVFENIKLKLPLDKTLAEKRKAMESALRWYEDASRFGVLELTTEATYKTAELYRAMAKDIMASERPSELAELELSQYNLLLDEQSAPIEEKATEIHEINYGRISVGVYDEWVKKSLLSLRSLFAGRYDKVEIGVGYFPPSLMKPAITSVSQPGGSSQAKVGVNSNSKEKGSPEYTVADVASSASCAASTTSLPPTVVSASAPQSVTGCEIGGAEIRNGMVLLERNDLAQAELSFEAIVKSQPNLPEGHFNLAWVKQQLAKHAEVREHVENGLKLSPGNASAYLLLALSERELGLFVNAESAYTNALSVAPDDDRVHLNAGVFYDLYLQRATKALEHYRRYQELQKTPNSKVAGWIVAIERVIAVKDSSGPMDSAEGRDAALAKEVPKTSKGKDAGGQKSSAELKKNVGQKKGGKRGIAE